jgi:phosphatase NudJ
MSNLITTSAIIEEEGRFLLVEEGNHLGEFNLPGGGPKSREELTDCVVREVEEEAGITVTPNYLVGIYQCTRTAARNNVTRLVFNCLRTSGELTTSEKHPTVDFFTYKAIKRLNESGNLRSSAVLQSILDYRNGQGFGLAAITYLPKEKKR